MRCSVRILIAAWYHMEYHRFAFLYLCTLSHAFQQTTYFDPKITGTLVTRRRGSPAFPIGDELRSTHHAVLAVAECQHWQGLLLMSLQCKREKE